MAGKAHLKHPLRLLKIHQVVEGKEHSGIL